MAIAFEWEAKVGGRGDGGRRNAVTGGEDGRRTGGEDGRRTGGESNREPVVDTGDTEEKRGGEAERPR